VAQRSLVLGFALSVERLVYGPRQAEFFVIIWNPEVETPHQGIQTGGFVSPRTARRDVCVANNPPELTQGCSVAEIVALDHQLRMTAAFCAAGCVACSHGATMRHHKRGEP
jgi:hypothetical protein